MPNQKEYTGCGAYARSYGAYRQASYARHFRSVPVNIEEKSDAFVLQLFAPALEKQHLKITAKNDILTISYNNPKEEEQDTNSAGFTRREYRSNSFERSFLLKGKVELDKISASYSEGVLTVNLPKDPERNTSGKNISVN